MFIFRYTPLKRFLTFFIGLVFLNLSFLLAEVSMLDSFGDNPELVENIVRMVASGGFEEEKDLSGEASLGIEKGINFLVEAENHLKSTIIFSLSKLQHADLDFAMEINHPDVVSPPPEI